jgi:hypothetical protein
MSLKAWINLDFITHKSLNLLWTARREKVINKLFTRQRNPLTLTPPQCNAGTRRPLNHSDNQLRDKTKLNQLINIS